MKKIQKFSPIAVIVLYILGFSYLTEAQEKPEVPAPKKVIPIGNITERDYTNRNVKDAQGSYKSDLASPINFRGLTP